MLRLPDAWTWDFWLADTGTEYHAFFLRASRALLDPDRRHFHASVGHAVSTDLREWTVTADALVPADQPRWDDMAIWTGSVVQGPDGVWRIFYTGISHAENGRVQRVGVATSDDLLTWHTREQPLITADPRWYAMRGEGEHEFEFWRDPWVFADPDGDGWHMLITARVNGSGAGRGVLAHAVSPDLETWTVRAPVTGPTTAPANRFGHLEVPQVVEHDGTFVLVFSCLSDQIPSELRPTPEFGGGTWCAPGGSPTGPFDIAKARLLTDDRLYATKLVRDREGRWFLLGFHNRETDGSFGGRLSDPLPITWDEAGMPVLSP